MSIIVPPGFSNVHFIWTCTGSVKQKVASLGVLGDPLTNPNALTIATTMYNIMVGSGRPCQASSMTNDYTFQGVSVTQNVAGLPVVAAYLVPLVGTFAGTAGPSNGSVLIKKVTAAGGRKNRGRLFLPPCNASESNIDSSGYIGASTLALIQAQWTSVLAAMGTALDLPYLFHSSALAPTPITSFSVESQLGTQRRRMR